MLERLSQEQHFSSRSTSPALHMLRALITSSKVSDLYIMQTGEGDAEYDDGHCQPPMMHIDLSTTSQDRGSSLQAQLHIDSQPKDGEAMDPVLHKVCILTR